jgi:hypothetical protein
VTTLQCILHVFCSTWDTKRKQIHKYNYLTRLKGECVKGVKAGIAKGACYSECGRNAFLAFYC